MIKMADIVASLRHCLAAQRELEQCRARATGDVEYFSYNYVQDLNQAETELEQTLNAYIDQRVALGIERLNTPSAFEALTPETRSPAMVS